MKIEIEVDDYRLMIKCLNARIDWTNDILEKCTGVQGATRSFNMHLKELYETRRNVENAYHKVYGYG